MGKKITVWFAVPVHGIIRPFFFGAIVNALCFLCNLLVSGLWRFKPGHTKLIQISIFCKKTLVFEWFICILWVITVVDRSDHSLCQILITDFLLWGFMKEKLYTGKLGSPTEFRTTIISMCHTSSWVCLEDVIRQIAEHNHCPLHWEKLCFFAWAFDICNKFRFRIMFKCTNILCTVLLVYSALYTNNSKSALTSAAD